MPASESKLVAAMTANSGYKYYPPFINVSRSGEYGTNVTVSLRGNESEDGACGGQVKASFTRQDFALFILECQKHLTD